MQKLTIHARSESSFSFRVEVNPKLMLSARVLSFTEDLPISLRGLVSKPLCESSPTSLDGRFHLSMLLMIPKFCFDFIPISPVMYC